MTEQPKVPGAPPPMKGTIFFADEPSDKAERRLIASLVRVLMRLPRVARYGLLAVAVGGVAELSGGIDMLLEPLMRYDPIEVRRPDRSHRPDLRLERADGEALRER